MGVVKVALTDREANDLPGEGFAWETGSWGKLYKLTIKWSSSSRVFNYLPNTLRVPSTDYFKFIASHKKYRFLKCLQNLSWKIRVNKMQGNFWKIIAACNVSKNAALLQVFFCHVLRTVPKDYRSYSRFFPSISTCHSVVFKFIHPFFINQMRDADFRTNRSCNAADTANGCQIMSYSHIKKI